MPPKQPQNHQYDASKIPYLTPREHVRRRPGMWVGGIDKWAMHNLVWEIIENSLIEVMSEKSPCNNIQVSLLSDTTIVIADNGNGIPAQIQQDGKSILELYTTQRLSRVNILEKRFQPVGGLMGIFMLAVNALSSHMIAETKHDGYLWRQEYKEGIPVTAVEQIRPLAESESTGTSITFSPDFSIFEAGLTFDYDLILERCRELAYLLPDVTFIVDSPAESNTLHYPQGIVGRVAELNQGVSTVHPVLYHDYSANLQDKSLKYYTLRVEVAFQFRAIDEGVIKGFLNTVYSLDSGTHLDGLEETLLSAIYGDSHHDLIDPLETIVAIIHVYHPDPEFAGVRKVTLLNPEVKEVVEDCIREMLAENPAVHAQLQGFFRR